MAIANGAKRGAKVPEADSRLGLTPRQREVAILIAEGSTNEEIAAKLGCSVGTVPAHRYQAIQRLGARSTAGLVHRAIQTGLVALGDVDREENPAWLQPSGH